MSVSSVIFRESPCFGGSLLPHMRNIDDIGSTNGLVYEEDTYAVIGAATDVYYRLGCSFLEPGIHRIHGIITEI